MKMKIENGFYGFSVSFRFVSFSSWTSKKAKKFLFESNNIKYQRNAYSETTFIQNCFPSSNKINEAFTMGARGGKAISALEEPNDMVGIWWTSLMWGINVEFVSFSSKHSLPAGQQKYPSTFKELVGKTGRLSDDALHERGRLVPKLPHDVERSEPRFRLIEGHLMIAIGVSSLKIKSEHVRKN